MDREKAGRRVQSAGCSDHASRAGRSRPDLLQLPQNASTRPPRSPCTHESDQNGQTDPKSRSAHQAGSRAAKQTGDSEAKRGSSRNTRKSAPPFGRTHPKGNAGFARTSLWTSAQTEKLLEACLRWLNWCASMLLSVTRHKVVQTRASAERERRRPPVGVWWGVVIARTFPRCVTYNHAKPVSNLRPQEWAWKGGAVAPHREPRSRARTCAGRRKCGFCTLYLYLRDKCRSSLRV